MTMYQRMKRVNQLKKDISKLKREPSFPSMAMIRKDGKVYLYNSLEWMSDDEENLTPHKVFDNIEDYNEYEKTNMCMTYYEQ